MSREKQIEFKSFGEFKSCKDCLNNDVCKKQYDIEANPGLCTFYKKSADYRKQEWISVDERLPEREGKYLVCTTNGNIGVGNFIDYYGKGTHLCFDCWAVTHWMPLPEAPKMKGGE